MIKFNTSNIPSFVTQDFLLDDKETKEQVIGYLIQTDNGSFRIEEGDYIEENSGKYTVYKASEYASNDIIKDLVRERMGKRLVSELHKYIDELNLTDVQELDLTTRLLPVIVYLGDGLIARAKKILTAMTAAGQLTGRKNAIMAKIDNELNNL